MDDQEPPTMPDPANPLPTAAETVPVAPASLAFEEVVMDGANEEFLTKMLSPQPTDTFTRAKIVAWLREEAKKIREAMATVVKRINNPVYANLEARADVLEREARIVERGDGP